MRRSLAWLVALPLMLAGSQVAHVFAYRWVYPQAGVRLHVLVETGHGYMAMLPFLLGAGGAVTVLSLLASVADAAGGREPRPLPAWAFALLPLMAFTLQEYLERWLAEGAFPWHAASAPTFLPGLALQLPFGLAAYLSARLLLRVAERVGRRLAPAAEPRRLRRPASSVVAAAPAPLLPRRPLISCGLAKRGPPLLLAV
jgi:hypothetical protein